MMRRFGNFILVCALLGPSLFVGDIRQTAAAERPPLEYNRDIRPILWENCFRCHGPDSASRKADLRLDRRTDALQNQAIVPGKPDESEVVLRVFSDDPEDMMPPPTSHKTLTQTQKEMLRRWVAEGAAYQPHWSFIAPTRPSLPEVKDQKWCRNPIDRFILARLESRGLAPAPEADRRTLARRLSLDLTGLPPAPDLVEAFVLDQSPNAYEALVDKLLTSEQWGEHRGRYWLDVARYADTHGIHFDNYREMWTYRDWVIDALNRNMPFDQFTIEQLAGDLLPKRSLQQQIASGFNRCNITTNEGGVIAEEYLVLYTRDRTETVSQVWMGLTTGCAVCHDHKFDPISQREFYELSAFFNNSTQGAMDGNIKDTPPIVVVPPMTERERWDALAGEVPAAKQQVEARKQTARPTFETWQATAAPEVVAPATSEEALYLRARLSEGEGRSTKIDVGDQPRDVALRDSAAWQPGVGASQALLLQGAAVELPDVADFEKDQSFTCAAWVRLPANDTSGALCARMDNGQFYRGWDFWMQRRQIGTHIINKWPEDAIKVVAKAQVPANEWVHVAVSYDGSSKAAGVKIYYNGQPQQPVVEADRLQLTIHTEVPFKIGQRHASDPLNAAGLQDLRIYKRVLAPGEIESLAKSSRHAAVLAKAPDQRTEAEKAELYSWWLNTQDTEFGDLTRKASTLEQEQAAIKSRSTVAHVMQERGEPAKAYILSRGDYDKRKDEVPARTPEILPAWSADQPHNRLGLARWLLAPEHPLTARVTVNRFWQEVFGTGLVRTTGDFGVAGELPSHPELLDWLAVEFRESGWDMKQFFKVLTTSAAYRQAAMTTPPKLEKDPHNRLLSRGPRYRMDAEMVRDYALAAGNLLVRKLGGPSVRPYQPDGVWEAVAMIGSNTRDYRRDIGESLYRRSMYTLWKRAAPPASMDVFNAPSRETCSVRRERTNTPLQALVTLNDVQFIEAERKLAERVLKEAPDTDARLHRLAAHVLARPWRGEELDVLRSSLAELLAYYESHTEDAKQLMAVGDMPADASLPPATVAAWTMLANEVLNMDEVLNK